jgi:hypothetical protein
VVPGGTVSYTVALTATGAFNQAVTLSCSGLPTSVTCAAPTPAAITPPGSATVNVTVANTIAPGTYSFTVNGANGATTHNQSVQLQVVPESLTLSASSGSASIAAGSSANFTMTAASISGVTGTVTLSCTGAPSGVGCNFAPVQVTVPANGNATTTLTVNVTSKPPLGSFHKFPKGPLPLQRIMVWWIIAALLLMSARMVASSRRGYATPPFLARRVAIMLLTIILSGGLISCAGLNTKTNTNTLPFSFTLTIQAQNQSGSVKASIPIQITVP